MIKTKKNKKQQGGANNTAARTARAARAARAAHAVAALENARARAYAINVKTEAERKARIANYKERVAKYNNLNTVNNPFKDETNVSLNNKFLLKNNNHYSA